MIKCALSSIGMAAVAVLAMVLYYEGLRLPLIGQIVDGAIARRLEGYVLLSEKTAADAKAAEIKRHADAATKALKAANDRASVAKAAEVKARSDLEKGIMSYEQRLLESNRRCLADDLDLDFILRHH